MTTSGQAQGLEEEVLERAEALAQLGQDLQDEIERARNPLTLVTIASMIPPLGLLIKASTAFTGTIILFLTEIPLRSIFPWASAQ